MNERTGLVYGLLAGLAFAAIYGLAAELFGLTWGLAVVGFVGGWAIGSAVVIGTWDEAEHAPVRRVRGAAALIAAMALLAGLVLAYVISQVLLPEAVTPLLERVTVSGFVAYLFGSDEFVRVVHVVALIAVAIMAWRAAR